MYNCSWQSPLTNHSSQLTKKFPLRNSGEGLGGDNGVVVRDEALPAKKLTN